MFWKIKKFFNSLKMKRQRKNQGYCNKDVWNIYYWFLDIMPKMLKDFNESRVSYPCDLSNDEWNNIIKRMIFCFEEANEDTCSQINKYNFDMDTEKWLEREDEISEYQNNMKNEGLKLFSKYFWNLWD